MDSILIFTELTELLPRKIFEEPGGFVTILRDSRICEGHLPSIYNWVFGASVVVLSMTSAPKDGQLDSIGEEGRELAIAVCFWRSHITGPKAALRVPPRMDVGFRIRGIEEYERGPGRSRTEASPILLYGFKICER